MWFNVGWTALPDSPATPAGPAMGVPMTLSMLLLELLLQSLQERSFSVLLGWLFRVPCVSLTFFPVVLFLLPLFSHPLFSPFLPIPHFHSLYTSVPVRAVCPVCIVVVPRRALPRSSDSATVSLQSRRTDRNAAMNSFV